MSETEVAIFEGQEDLQRNIAPVLEMARELAIITLENRGKASAYLQSNKCAQAQIEAYWKEPIDKARDACTTATIAKKSVLAKRDEMIAPFIEGEKIVKDKALAFDDAEESKRLVQQQRVQAEANARTEAERQRLLKQAEKIKTPELREARLAEAESLFTPTVNLAPVVPKAKGEYTVRRWEARLIDITELIQAAANGNPLAICMLKFDQVAANKQAVASKNHIVVPGIDFCCETSLAVKTK